MIVSVRCPEAATPPALSFFFSAGLSPRRLSEPTSRYVVPGCSPGRAPAGDASTLGIRPHAQIGPTTRNPTHATSTSPPIFFHGPRREPPVPPVERGGATGWAGCV